MTPLVAVSITRFSVMMAVVVGLIGTIDRFVMAIVAVMIMSAVISGIVAMFFVPVVPAAMTVVTAMPITMRVMFLGYLVVIVIMVSSSASAICPGVTGQ